jgi:class 3 adenylate cyclase
MQINAFGEPSTSRRMLAGEWRMVTILFSDVKGSTAMAEHLDPEDWAEIMNEAFDYLTKPVIRYRGTVARLMGDAVLAFFGAPTAHEDDPLRAVLAGLDIVNGIQSFRQHISSEFDLDFNVRVGINTGVVVVGEMGSALAGEYTAMGDAVNLAARMEQTAKPGTVQITNETYRLVAPWIEVESLGEVEAKGKSGLVSAYCVLGRKIQPTRARGIAGLGSPLVGRDQEYARLGTVGRDLLEGQGRIITLIG